MGNALFEPILQCAPRYTATCLVYDLVFCYIKCYTGCDVFIPAEFACTNTRGNNIKLKHICYTDIRSFFVITEWKILTNDLLMSPYVGVLKVTA